MKNHVVFKFLAVALCALALLTAVSGSAVLITLAAMGINEDYTVEDAHEARCAGSYNWAAVSVVKRYASRTLGDCPESLINGYFGPNPFGSRFRENRVFYTIADEQGKLLETTVPDAENLTVHSVTVKSTQYMKLVNIESAVHEFAVDAGPRIFEEANAAASDNVSQTSTFSAIDEDGGSVVYRYVREDSPAYEVALYLAPNALVNDQGWNILRIAWNFRTAVIISLGLSLLIFAALAVYLCTVAGRSPDSQEIVPQGFNRLPLDLYFVAAFSLVAGIGGLVFQMGEYLSSRDYQVVLACMLYGGYAACLIFVGFCYCVAAQFKTPDSFLLKNTICFRCLTAIWCGLVWLFRNGPAIIGNVCSGLWHLSCRIVRAGGIVLKWFALQLTRPLRWAWGRVHALLRLLPVIWQWFVVTVLVLTVLMLTLILHWRLGAVLVTVGGLGIIVYAAWGFGTLFEGAQRMRSGDLEEKIETDYLVGGYRDFAYELNGLADVARISAQRELKSERMKTELITNVSHDIKTPLTSIINYVDLLQRPHTPEQGQQYLEVLSRQSHRMKKLIEDLLELSKASSGSMAVEIMTIDAAEAVNQALGEFADKLEAADLTPVFRSPEEPVMLLADGRLMWRAASNILSNVVKYALPGTRVYIDLSISDGKAVISFKNISREPLNIRAEELLERFVRGDTSRNTEGSGLGLNIAQSLMELQNGQLQLLVDGDLFKVSLVFPLAKQE